MSRHQRIASGTGRGPFTVECLTCSAIHDAERDEDGVSIEQWPCQGSDTCTVQMCGACRVVCECCGLPACETHRTDVDGVFVCDLCAERADVKAWMVAA